VIIFDFDGILLNSVLEVAVTAYNAVSGKLATSKEELPSGCLESFVRNRFHFQPAGDVLPLMGWCLEYGSVEPERILSAKEYRSLLEAEKRPIRERTEKFFSTRKLFVERNREKWLALNEPYEPLWSSLRELGAGRVVILTNKNRQAVLDLTEHFNLRLEPENVYSGDGAVKKDENLRKLHARFRASHYLFVDDSLGNLRELREDFPAGGTELELRLAFGTWGYLGPNDKLEAETEGLPMFSQADIISLLREELP